MLDVTAELKVKPTMKSTRKYILAVCVLALGFAAPVMHAEEPASPPAKKEGGPKQDRENLKEKLGLSDEQAAQIKKIRAEEREQIKAVRDKDLEPKEMHKEVQKIRQDTRAKVDAVLTEEQRAKRDEMMKKGKPDRDQRKPRKEKEPKGPPPAEDPEM